MIYIVWIISLIAIFFLGYFQREIVNKVQDLHDKVNTPPVEVGPTNPYHVVDENKVYNNTKKVGAVLPKSPELLMWEEQEAIKKLNNASL